MTEFNKQRRLRKNKKLHKGFFSQGILDVIESDYSERYDKISEDYNRIKMMFSEKEWIDILTKSRHSHENFLGQIKK